MTHDTHPHPGHTAYPGSEEPLHRRRTIAIGSGALAAVVVLGALVLGHELGKPDATRQPGPATALALRTGEPIHTWTDEHGRLHLDGTTVPGDWAGAVTSGDLTTAAQGPYDTGTVGVFLGSAQVGTARGVAVPDLPVSPDHRTIAWVAFGDTDHTTSEIVVARVDSGGIHELGRLGAGRDLLPTSDTPRVRLLRVADDGTVLYGAATGAGSSWTPGGRPQAADVSAYQGGPDGFTTEPAQDLRLNAQRTWGAWSTDRLPDPDPDNAVFTSVTVQRAGDVTTRYEMPFADDYAYVNVVGWENDTDVLLYADTQPPGRATAGNYLRCDVVVRHCEIAPAPGDERSTS